MTNLYVSSKNHYNQQQLTTIQQKIRFIWLLFILFQLFVYFIYYSFRWPDPEQCNHCFKEKYLGTSVSSSSSSSSLVEGQWEKNILTYLQSSYWNINWKLQTPLSLTNIIYQVKLKSTTTSTLTSIKSSNTINLSDSIENSTEKNDSEKNKIFPLVANISSSVFTVFIFISFLLYVFFYKKSLFSNCFRKRTN